MKQKKHVKKDWIMAGATLTGSSHRRNERPNQDAYYFKYADGKTAIAILAVSDGAGSAPHSAEGSQIAVTTAVNAIARELRKRRAGRKFHYHRLTRKTWTRTSKKTGEPRPARTVAILRKAFMEACRAIASHALAQEEVPDDYAATLLLAVATPRWIVAAQIGDGAIVAINSFTKQALTLCESHTGEYANETVFITSKASRQGKKRIHRTGANRTIRFGRNNHRWLRAFGTKDARPPSPRRILDPDGGLVKRLRSSRNPKASWQSTRFTASPREIFRRPNNTSGLYTTLTTEQRSRRKPII